MIIAVVQCGDPGTLTNGKKIVIKGLEYGGSVEFKCNKGYTLEGTHIIYCRTDKLWSSSVPHCRGQCYFIMVNGLIVWSDSPGESGTEETVVGYYD